LFDDLRGEFVEGGAEPREHSGDQRTYGGDFRNQILTLFICLPPVMGHSPQRAFCHAVFTNAQVFVSAFSFSMFSALGGENRLSRSFVFNMFSA
jgi:hypothetical protein